MSDEFETEYDTPRTDAATVLRRLGDGVATGSVQFGDDLVVDVPDQVELEIEYESGDGEREIEVELEWEDEEAEAEDEEDEEAEAEDDEGDEADEDDEPEPMPAPSEVVAPVLGGDEGSDSEDGLTDSKAEFELYEDNAGQWRWRLVHDNGNIIADSGEGYDRKAGARNGLESVMANASGADVVEQE